MLDHPFHSDSVCSGQTSELEEVIKETYSSPARLTQKEGLRETYPSPIHSRFTQKTILNLNSLSPAALTPPQPPGQPSLLSPASLPLSSLEHPGQSSLRSPFFPSTSTTQTSLSLHAFSLSPHRPHVHFSPPSTPCNKQRRYISSSGRRRFEIYF